MDINKLIALSITSDIARSLFLGNFKKYKIYKGDEDGYYDIRLFFEKGTMKYKDVKLDDKKNILEMTNSVIINDKISFFVNHIYDNIFVKKTAHIMKGGY